VQVNKYPSQRVFNAIGLGGDGFRANMLAAVEEVVGTVHVECVSQRPSSGGKYVSVRIGPVWVESGDQVGLQTTAGWAGCSSIVIGSAPGCARVYPVGLVRTLHLGAQCCKRACTLIATLYTARAQCRAGRCLG
jgi:putative lipoic acid-binding regulatory protein